MFKSQKKNIKRSAVVTGVVILAVLGFITFYHNEGHKQASPSHITKVIAIGDSNTYGSGVVNDDRLKNSYPAQLQSLLGNTYDVENYGVSGSTLLDSGDVPYTKQKAYAESLASNPDITLIMLGTNDSKPYNWNAAQYEVQLAALVRKHASLPGRPQVYLLTVPAAFNVTGDFKSDVINRTIVPIIRRVALHTGTPLIDVYTATKDHSALFEDGIHPDAEGYGIIARTVYRAIK